MDIDLLILGNGFDIAHGLHTQYRDFLQYIDLFQRRAEIFISNPTPLTPDRLDPRELKIEQMKEHIRSLKANIPLQNAFSYMVDNNIWFMYFKQQEAGFSDGWVGFEGDVAAVVHLLDLVRDEYMEKAKIHSNSIYSTISHDVLVKIFSTCGELKTRPARYKLFWREKYVSAEEYHKKSALRKLFFRPYYDYSAILHWRDLLLHDLNRVTRALELYLSEYVCKKTVYEANNTIKGIVTPEEMNKPNPLKVLSFNYTETFESVFRTQGDQKPEVCYIHGKVNGAENIRSLIEAVTAYEEAGADEKKVRKNQLDDMLPNSMVLGISSQLTTAFPAFQKDLQRIMRISEGGTSWKNWLDHTIKTVHIFGHSLDETDKDVIGDIIIRSEKTNIYYHNRNAHAQLIENLKKMIGAHEMNRRVYCSSPTITFVQQE